MPAVTWSSLSDQSTASGTSSDQESGAQLIQLRTAASGTETTPTPTNTLDGSTWVDVAEGDAFNLTDRDFTIAARIKTTNGGTIFSKTEADGEWVPNGKTLFVRGGRLCYDIGWVGVVQTRQRVNDGEWHDVALRYRANDAEVQLIIDGEVQGTGMLRPEDPVRDHHVKLGYTSADFPDDGACFGC